MTDFDSPKDAHASSLQRPGARGVPAPLDDQEIRCLLDTLGRATFRDIHVLDEVDSTNRWLADQMAATGTGAAVCVAEAQSAGRGRRGRSWRSPPGGNIYLSLGWMFEAGPRALSGLGLVAGVVVAGAIHDEGIPGVELKWPNDLLAGNGKLGGILAEMTSEDETRSRVVIGVGLNVCLPQAQRAGIEQAVTDLVTLARGPVNRIHLIARIVNGFAYALPRFEREGLRPFRHTWSVLDRTCDRDVMLHGPRGARAGHAVGIDDDGALLVRTSTGIERVHAGDVTLRVSL